MGLLLTFIGMQSSKIVVPDAETMVSRVYGCRSSQLEHAGHTSCSFAKVTCAVLGPRPHDFLQHAYAYIKHDAEAMGKMTVAGVPYHVCMPSTNCHSCKGPAAVKTY